VVSSCAQQMLQNGQAESTSTDPTQLEGQLANVDIIFSGSELSNPKCATYSLGAIDHPRNVCFLVRSPFLFPFA